MLKNSVTVFVAGAVTLGFMSLPARADTSRVVTSIKPVHSLVSMVTEGIAEPYLIVKGANSPHGHSLRPSDAKALAAADAIFWVGPGLETFLTKPLTTLPAHARIVRLMEEGEVHEHDAKHDDEKHEHEEEHADAHGHHHDGPDPHIWLDPEHAREIVEHVAETMAEILPGEAARIAENRGRALAALKALEEEVGKTVAPYTHEHIAVLHDAYGSFTRHYGLKDFITLTVSPEHKPTPGQIRDVKHEIEEHGVKCVFAEPQFPDTHIKLLLEGSKARPGVLDPLGASLEPGASLYPQLLRGLATSLKACLDGTS